MKNLLLTNIRVNLKFFRRNRILIVVSVFMGIIFLISMIPSLFFITRAEHMDLVKRVFSTFSEFLTLIVGIMGMLYIHHHTSNRNLKMVFTKPCTPEVWLLSGIASAMLISSFLYLLSFIICSIFFAVWSIPLYHGLFLVALNEFFQSMIVFTYISFLTLLMHPVIVILFIIIFQEGFFYSLKVILAGGIKALNEGAGAAFLKAMKFIVDILYFIVPTFSPYHAKLSDFYSSLRVDLNALKYLSLSFGYTATAVALFYFLSLHLIKKKRLI